MLSASESLQLGPALQPLLADVCRTGSCCPSAPSIALTLEASETKRASQVCHGQVCQRICTQHVYHDSVLRHPRMRPWLLTYLSPMFPPPHLQLLCGSKVC